MDCKEYDHIIEYLKNSTYPECQLKSAKVPSKAKRNFKMKAETFFLGDNDKLCKVILQE